MKNIEIFDLAELNIMFNRELIDIYTLGGLLNEEIDPKIIKEQPLLNYINISYFPQLNKSDEFVNNYKLITEYFAETGLNEILEFASDDNFISKYPDLIDKIDNFFDIYTEIPNRYNYWNNHIKAFSKYSLKELIKNNEFHELNESFIKEYNDLTELANEIQTNVRKYKQTDKVKANPAAYVLNFNQ